MAVQSPQPSEALEADARAVRRSRAAACPRARARKSRARAQQAAQPTRAPTPCRCRLRLGTALSAPTCVYQAEAASRAESPGADSSFRSQPPLRRTHSACAKAESADKQDLTHERGHLIRALT
eukprot:1022376-Pleurochrysis_carterae.AAC.1